MIHDSYDFDFFMGEEWLDSQPMRLHKSRSQLCQNERNLGHNKEHNTKVNITPIDRHG